MGRRGSALAVMVVFVFALGAAGCSGDDDNQSFEKVGASISGSEDSNKPAASGSGGISPAQAPDREVIYTADLVVRVTDVSRAAERARDFADEAGGYVADQSADLEGDQEISATLRVPASGFDAVMTKVAALGKVQKRDLDSQDVTDQVVDLEGRLANAKVSSERLRELLAKAENVVNILAIESELTKRETEIEQITGQLQVLQSQVDLSTITIRFTERDEPTVSKDVPGFFGAVKSGGVAVVNVLLVAAAVAGFVLPFLPFLVLGWFGIRAWRRRHPKRPPSVTPGWPGSAPPPPAPVAPWNPPPPSGADPVAPPADELVPEPTS